MAEPSHERPKLPGYEFADFYKAAQPIAGDYFDYILLPGNRVVIVQGDVVGKDEQGALRGWLSSSFRNQLLSTPSITEALERLNAELTASEAGRRFVTCVVALVDPERNDVRVANAGHPQPMWRRAGRTVELVARNESGMPLGIAADQSFAAVVLPFGEGDTLIFYTDGIAQAMNPDNCLYGLDRLRGFIGSGPVSVAELVKGIAADVERFCEGRRQPDDMCLVGFERTSV